MSSVLDVVAPEPRALIVDELARSNPGLLEALREAQKPTNEQSDAVVDVLSSALMKTFGADWEPSDHGLAIERAIDAYLGAWPIHR